MIGLSLGVAADIVGRAANIYSQRKAANEYNRLQNLKRRMNEDRQYSADAIQHNLDWYVPDDDAQY